MNANAYCIETQSLTKQYGDLTAVDKIDLQVPKGTFYGFLGPNGAGKSTTIKMLTGLTAPTLGTATLLGYDLKEDSLNIKQRIGVVPEELCLFENLTAWEYLFFIGRMYRMPLTTIKQRASELLDLMNLAENQKSLILEFSHGMKKKLSLAGALIHNPELLFLDEPFEGIDPIASRTIKNVLERLIERQSTVFLTSHIMEIVEKLCTHVGIINKGKLIRQGPLCEISQSGSLEETFVEAVGETDHSTTGLSWLKELSNG